MKTISSLTALAVVAVTAGCLQTAPAPVPPPQPLVEAPPLTIPSPSPVVPAEPPPSLPAAVAADIAPPPATLPVAAPAVVPAPVSAPSASAASKPAPAEAVPAKLPAVAKTTSVAKPQAAVASGPKVVTYPASFGAVGFNHQQHAASNACSACHPTMPPAKVTLGKDKAHQLCKGCHQKKGAPSACTACHKKG